MANELNDIITQIGISGDIFLVIVILAIVVVGAVIVIIASRPVLDIYPYLNPSARVRARAGRIFSEKEITELVDAADIDEVENYLRGSPEYAEVLDNYTLDKALDIQSAKTYDFIASLAPSDVKDPFVTMAKKTDINNIKTLLTAKEVGLTNDEIKDLLIPAGSLYSTMESLIDGDNIHDIVAGLDHTEYGSVLEDAIPKYEDTGMVLPLEAALDNYYLERLLGSSEVPADENKQIIYSFVGTKVDIANIKLIIRAKEDGLDYDTISPYMYSQGYQLREWKLKDLMESHDVANVISSLEGTKYADALAESLTKYNESGSVAVFEKALDVYAANSAKSLANKKPLGVGPIIGYLSKKEVEIRNLKIILRAKREANFPKTKIMEMLI